MVLKYEYIHLVCVSERKNVVRYIPIRTSIIYWLKKRASSGFIFDEINVLHSVEFL